MLEVTIGGCKQAARTLGEELNARFGTLDVTRVWGVPRGGFNAAMLLVSQFDNFVMVDDPKDAMLAIDDIVDTGRTAARVRELYGIPTAALFAGHDYDAKSTYALGNVIDIGVQVEKEDGFINFPWERKLNSDGYDSAEDSVVRMLSAIGEDANREGLRETPKRVVKAWGEWFKGYGQNPMDVLKVFEDGAERYDEMVLVSNIQVHSKCEHHCADIFGLAHVAYIPNGKIVGLSKLTRLVDIFARRLQVQERLTAQIADALNDSLQPLGCGVVLQCRHMCMESRGVSAMGTVTTTSAMRGAFSENISTRSEFLRLIDGARNGIHI